MKLNASVEMNPLSFVGFTDIHPFSPKEQCQGYYQLIDELNQWLCCMTGMDYFSFQPNSGAQGELTGLLIAKAYHQSIGEVYRDIVFIPSSAHGTNFASTTMSGNKVVIIPCYENGSINTHIFHQKIKEFGHRLSNANDHLPIHPWHI